jgi:hypothetical protein
MEMGRSPVSLDEVIKAMQPIADQKVVWRGMSGGTMYSKVNNERSGFYGGIDDQARNIMKGLEVMHPAFGAFSLSKVLQFGTPNIMIPIQPYKAMQSAKLRDLVYKSDLDTNDLVDSYSERMDLEDSEIVFDIKEYYMISIAFAIEQAWDPDGFASGKLGPRIKQAVKSIKTYQDVIDILTEK